MDVIMGVAKFEAPFYDTRSITDTLSEIGQHMQTYCISSTM
jgi:hypothetical protein